MTTATTRDPRPRRTKKPAHEHAMDALLEKPFPFPDGLLDRTHSRVQDDCDGDLTQVLAVSLSHDGDAWVRTMQRLGTLRFRSDFGGGMSPRVRNALIVLAEAIRRDNEDRPQRPRRGDEA
jgi:hypothetical protein